MYNSSDQFYTEGGYYQSNPDWHQEGSKFKAELVLEFIKKDQLRTGLVVEVGCGAGEILAGLVKNWCSLILFCLLKKYKEKIK